MLENKKRRGNRLQFERRRQRLELQFQTSYYCRNLNTKACTTPLRTFENRKVIEISAYKDFTISEGSHLQHWTRYAVTTYGLLKRRTSFPQRLSLRTEPKNQERWFIYKTHAQAATQLFTAEDSPLCCIWSSNYPHVDHHTARLCGILCSTVDCPLHARVKLNLFWLPSEKAKDSERNFLSSQLSLCSFAEGFTPEDVWFQNLRKGRNLHLDNRQISALTQPWQDASRICTSSASHILVYGSMCHPCA